MKIYILPVKAKFQPKSQPFIYPKHNKDFGVEQDFLRFLKANTKLLTDKPQTADWHYLPIFWTRWHLNHDYGKIGLNVLQSEVNRVVIDSRKTFTICQYDDGPKANLAKTKIFLSSRKTKTGIDIPLLSSRLKTPLFKYTKKYLASFIGRLSTHPIRQQFASQLVNTPDITIIDGDIGTHRYTKTILESYVALCPRGYGGSSFRFYEAMQLGVVPLLIGDIDTRPFKQDIAWEECSLYASNPTALKKILRNLPIQKALQMGKQAKKVYEQHLQYGAWCKYVLKAIE